jgi:nucleoside 2-deoxyribosyltransferase
MLRIYLAGGMYNKWRDSITEPLRRISSSFSMFKFYDPCATKLTEPTAYTTWDLKAIRDRDIVVGYMEVSNPSGYGLNFELGYAKALGKTIVLLLDGHFLATDERAPYFNMAIVSADVVVYTYRDVVDFIEAFEKVS